MTAGAQESTCLPGGGRSWWAHLDFTRINIAPTILRKKIEEGLESSAQRTARDCVLGPALLQNRKPVLVDVRKLEYRFTSLVAASRFETKKVNEKLRKGYERRTRWR